MHEKVYSYFEKILSQHVITGKVLEVGAVPTKDGLLFSSMLNGATQKIGINLDGGQTMIRLSEKQERSDVNILTGNSNDMSFFKDGEFQVVLSSSTAEHDKYFWKTIGEMKRVLNVGGLMIICVPGYVREITLDISPLVTFTHRVHDWPGDYYRFSEQACREVFFEDFEVFDQKALMVGKVPNIITAGMKRK